MVRVFLNACTVERSWLRNQDNVATVCSIRDLEHIRAGRQRDARQLPLRLTVKSWRDWCRTCRGADAAKTPSRTTPHNGWTISRATFLPPLNYHLRRPCAVRSAVVNAPTRKSELESPLLAQRREIDRQALDGAVHRHPGRVDCRHPVPMRDLREAPLHLDARDD